MDSIYSKKSNIKLLLLVLAVLIGATTFFYTNRLVHRIADEEKEQVKLWAEAIDKKAELIRFTNILFKKLAQEELKKVSLWAEATRKLANISGNEDFFLALKVVEDNTTVPVILANDKDEIVSSRNLPDEIANDKDKLKKELLFMKSAGQVIEIEILEGKKNFLYYKDSKIFTELRNTMGDLIGSFISEVALNSTSVPVLFANEKMDSIIAYGNIDSNSLKNTASIQALIEEMKAENPPIKVNLGNGVTSYVLYKDSTLLTQLKYFPLVQFGAVAFFVLLGYWLFSTVRNAEQNRVWVGLAKETAHQLGTPLSSLMAWMEYLKSSDKFKEEPVVKDLQKDVDRLETITERFSNIGSVPILEEQKLNEVITDFYNYLQKRVSQKVQFEIINNLTKETIKLNTSLFEWVIENISKNAIDAMSGDGKLSITLSNVGDRAAIDISDNGKGMTANQRKQVFNPGFTTKRRGWGLGLTLAKRIIEEYHGGKLLLKNSQEGKGTTFRILI